MVYRRGLDIPIANLIGYILRFSVPKGDLLDTYWFPNSFEGCLNQNWAREQFPHHLCLNPNKPRWQSKITPTCMACQCWRQTIAGVHKNHCHLQCFNIYLAMVIYCLSKLARGGWWRSCLWKVILKKWCISFLKFIYFQWWDFRLISSRFFGVFGYHWMNASRHRCIQNIHAVPMGHFRLWSFWGRKPSTHGGYYPLKHALQCSSKGSLGVGAGPAYSFFIWVKIH